MREVQVMVWVQVPGQKEWTKIFSFAGWFHCFSIASEQGDDGNYGNDSVAVVEDKLGNVHLVNADLVSFNQPYMEEDKHEKMLTHTV